LGKSTLSKNAAWRLPVYEDTLYLPVSSPQGFAVSMIDSFPSHSEIIKKDPIMDGTL
jgi:hypothetical protein